MCSYRLVLLLWVVDVVICHQKGCETGVVLYSPVKCNICLLSVTHANVWVPPRNRAPKILHRLLPNTNVMRCLLYIL